MAIVATEVFFLWLGVRIIYQPPPFAVVALTFAWYLFAAPINFTAGDLLSMYSPKRIDYAVFGRQRASPSTVFVSLGVQLLVTGTGVLVVFVATHYGNLWIANLTLLGLSIPSIAGYLLLLSRMEKIAMDRREVLATELCRA
jgi:ABC-2 type transport system permease protein